MNLQEMNARKEKIRNFSIIAHIDHGKSTLADRIIQMCGGLDAREMQAQVLAMLELAKKALQEESQDLATSVFAKDNLLDEINAEATTILAGYIAKHPDSVLPCLNLVSVFRKLERSGDHITNIAEEIVFFIDAKVLKHSGKTDEHYPLSKK